MNGTVRGIRRGIALCLMVLSWWTTPAQAQSAGHERLSLMVGRSIVLPTDFDVTRMAVTNPAIADATVIEPREVLIDGKAEGTISLILWGSARRLQYDVVVETPKVVQLPVATGSQQVMLQVRFAEVNRRAVLELGASLLASRSSFAARSTTQQFASPAFDSQNGANRLVFSDFLNLFFASDQGIATVIRALQARGYFHSLAEPNLIAYNGQEASFLAGGEFPVPIVQGGAGLSGAAAVTVVFKEFGIRLAFRPTIVGDVIRLKVKPEVSTLDFNNGVSLQGFRIPALTTRRAETEVELRDGQSFAIAGLMDNTAQQDRAAIPILGSLPIVGPLFKSRAERREQTELLVLITPHLVQPLGPGEIPVLPMDPKLFLPRGRTPQVH